MAANSGLSVAGRTLRTAIISYKDYSFKLRLAKDQPVLPDGFFALEIFQVHEDDSEEILYTRHFKDGA